MKYVQALCVTAAAVLAGLAGTAKGQFDELRPVALSGTQAPGLPTGVVFDFFAGVAGSTDRSSTNNNRFLVSAVLTGPGVNTANDTVLLRGDSTGQLDIVAREGAQVPGLPAGTTFRSFSDQKINEAGSVAFRAELQGPDVQFDNNSAIFSDRGGSGVELIMREGDQAPGLTAGVVYSNPSDFLFNEAGRIAFSIRLTGTDVTGANDRAIFAEGNSAGLVPIAREGDDAIGVGPGTVYSSLDTNITGNGVGDIGWRATLSDPVVDSAFYVGSADAGFTPALISGGQADGVPSGIVIDLILNGLINDSGQVLLQTRLSGPGVTSGNQDILYRGSIGSSLTPVLREGDPAPGLNTGVTISSIGASAFSSDGRIALPCNVDDPGSPNIARSLLYSEQGTAGLIPIARSFDQAIGLNTGLRYPSFDSELIQRNDSDQIVFGAFELLVGTSSNPGFSSRDAVWMTDADGSVRLVVTHGSELDVNEDPMIEDLRTVSSQTTLASQFSGANYILNDNGELLFSARFTDGSSAVLVGTVTPPPAQECPGDIADDFGTLGADGQVSFGDFLSLLGLIGPCPGGTPGCVGDIADDFGTLGNEDGQVSFGDFLALLGLIGPCP